MRQAKEREAWPSLKKAHATAPTDPYLLGDGSSIDLAAACIVLSGRNGSGKSRLLRELQAQLGASGVLLDMHHLCEQALIILRSRTDLGEMSDEFESLGPDEQRLEDVTRIVGRDYESVEWFALEIEPDDPEVAARFRWAGDEEDQSLVPYFRAKYRGLDYTSRDMGLGEFSVHFLFWILEQYREVKDVTLLLDEPDAYLPPIGVERLLDRLLDICLRRRWRLIISTHSEEMIARAVDEEALTVLRVDGGGSTTAIHAVDVPDVALDLMSRPPITDVLFCEDESAWHLTRALLDAHDGRRARATSVIWGDGHGYLRELHKALPQPPRSEIRFAYVFDGDQRGTEGQLAGRWPAAFLPTNSDPDTLFQVAAGDRDTLAGRLGTNVTTLEVALDAIEADDAHDWVNKLGDRFGRPVVLRSLAALWVEANASSAAEFVAELEGSVSAATQPGAPPVPDVADRAPDTAPATSRDPQPPDRSLRARARGVLDRLKNRQQG